MNSALAQVHCCMRWLPPAHHTPGAPLAFGPAPDA